MSTIFAVQTHSPLESIIIAADRQRSDEEDGSKHPIPKLFSGDFWVMGDVGGDEIRELNRFYGILRGDGRYGSDKENGKKIIEEAIEKKRFMMVDELNATLSAKNKGDYFENSHKFILAVNRPQTGLWLIDEWGNLVPPSANEEKEFDYICIGSGAPSVGRHIKYLLSQGKIDRSNIMTAGGIYIMEECMDAAVEDLKTGLGYDSHILDKEGINEISKRITKSMVEARKKETTAICGDYTKREEEILQKESSVSINNP